MSGLRIYCGIHFLSQEDFFISLPTVEVIARSGFIMDTPRMRIVWAPGMTLAILVILPLTLNKYKQHVDKTKPQQWTKASCMLSISII